MIRDRFVTCWLACFDQGFSRIYLHPPAIVQDRIMALPLRLQASHRL